MKNTALSTGMGGLTSGRTPYATTPEDRECLKLDVNEFTDALNSDGESSGTISWGDAEIAFAIFDEEPEQIQLKYTTTLDDETVEHDYAIRVTRTECNFGGTRPWWRCPRCRDRVGTLYLPPKARKFYCRDCHDVAYTSSRASGNTDRTLRMRYNRIRKKLGADPAHPNDISAGIPDRPKGMHQETYEDLVKDLEQARREWEQKAYLGPLKDHYGIGPDDSPLDHE